ncbi:hypothetical protein A2U01_0101578, partial [Trifolium medium]|nr:hypothetical protein [Trifolium medium]
IAICSSKARSLGLLATSSSKARTLALLACSSDFNISISDEEAPPTNDLLELLN